MLTLKIRIYMYSLSFRFTDIRLIQHKIWPDNMNIVGWDVRLHPDVIFC